MAKGQKPKCPFTKENASEMGRRGAAKSNEVQRRKADILGFIDKKLTDIQPDGKCKDERIAEVLLALAEKGDMVAIKEVLDRVHGKVKDKVDVKKDDHVYITWKSPEEIKELEKKEKEKKQE